jgi:hypothetical protein
MSLKLIRSTAVPDPTAESSPAHRGTLDPARLLVILHRIDTGFYQQDEVLDRIADRVALDLP